MNIKKKLKLFPLNGEWVERDVYLGAIAREYTRKFKIEVPASHVKKMVLEIHNGAEIDSSTSSEQQIEIWNRVAEDVAAAQEYSGLSKKQRARQVELDIISAAKQPVPYAEALARFHETFDLGPNLDQCIPKKEVTEVELGGALAFAFGINNLSGWAIGDLVLALEERGHENAVIQICSDFGMSYPTVYGYRDACLTFEPGSRNRASFSVYREIASARILPDRAKEHEVKTRILDEAVKQNLSSKEVRNVVARERELAGVKKRGRPALNAPEAEKLPVADQEPSGDDEKSFVTDRRYFVIDMNEVFNSYFTSTLPELANNEIMVVDIKIGEVYNLESESWQPLHRVQ